MRSVAAFVTGFALLLGGCQVTTGDREPSSKVDGVLAKGAGEFDLTGPPSRDEAGLPEGRTHVTHERDDKSPFHVRVLLPEGQELDLSARLVGFDSLNAPDPKTGPPTTLDIHVHAESLTAGRDQLLAVAGRFDLDPKPVREWHDEAASPRPVEAPPTARTPWLTTSVGYLRLDVQGRHKPPIDSSDPGQTVVHYLLTWEADAAPSAD